MRTLWCLLLVIICLLKYCHSSLSRDTGSSQEVRNFKVANETTFHLCQNALRRVISRLTNSEAFVKVLREKESRANEWIFRENSTNGKKWCMDKESPLVYISWNQEAKTCMNLRVFDKTDKWNIKKHICEQFTNHSSIDGNTGSIKSRPKRESKIKSTYGFVNIAKEWKKKSCRRLMLEIYLNKELLVSNGTSEEKAGEENGPADQMKVYINANLTNLQAKLKKKYYFVQNAVPFATAKQDCFEKGMRLLSVKNADENKDIVEAMKNEAPDIYWTSGNMLANHKTWRWADSEKIKYFSWTNGEPNNAQGNEYCMDILKTGEWNDNVCNVNLPYICEVLDIPEDVMMPTMEIFVDGKLVFDNSSKSGSDMDQAPTVSVHIGLDDNNKSDHSTIVLFTTKYSSKDSVEVKDNLVVPKGFTPESYSGIDFIVEMITEKDFSCPKTYQFAPQTIKLNHSEALQYCQNRSMDLVSIQDEEEHLAVEKEMKKRNINHFYWTSGYQSDGVWYWNEKEKITYTSWARGEPNNKTKNEKCIEIYIPNYNARWNDQACYDKNYVICESLD